MKRQYRVLIYFCLLLPLSVQGSDSECAPCENLIIFTLDGVRRVEVFEGAHLSCLESCSLSANEIKKVIDEFWDPDPLQRRMKLMPFLWELVPEGQLFGQEGSGAEIQLKNLSRQSYAGYHEIFCGFDDPNILGNDEILNPHLTVLEWLHSLPKYRGSVAAFCSWNHFSYIFNQERCEFVVNAGWNPLEIEPLSERQQLINQLNHLFPLHKWDYSRFDALTYYQALEYLKTHKPKILYMGFNEPDEWGHEKNYLMHLYSIRAIDQFVKELWDLVQTMPEYKEKTTLVITVDHGRGATGEDWCDHDYVDNASYTWLFAIGPGIPSLGIRKGEGQTLFQGQLAATFASILGEDFQSASSEKVLEPIRFSFE